MLILSFKDLWNAKLTHFFIWLNKIKQDMQSQNDLDLMSNLVTKSASIYPYCGDQFCYTNTTFDTKPGQLFVHTMLEQANLFSK